MKSRKPNTRKESRNYNYHTHRFLLLKTFTKLEIEIENTMQRKTTSLTKQWSDSQTSFPTPLLCLPYRTTIIRPW